MFSICSTCQHACRVASDELQKQGYIGCEILLVDSRFDAVSLLTETKGMGWVDLGSRFDSEKRSGIITNDMLITRYTESYPRYRELPIPPPPPPRRWWAWEIESMDGAGI